MARIPALLFPIALSFAACGGNTQVEETPASVVEDRVSLAQLDEHHSFESPLTVGNLTVWPVRTDQLQTTGTVTSLWEAEKNGLAIVREEGGGSVNQLIVENKGDTDIFICGGTVLKGGKQDRQVGRDVLIIAGETTPIPAFCIERGRWDQLRAGEGTSGVFTCAGILAAKRIRVSAQYASDQGQVWQQVDTVNSKAEKTPASSTFLATIEEPDEAAIALREKLESAVRAHLANKNDDGIVGFAYAINGEPLTIRTFANAQVFRSQLSAFLRTMCLEAQVAQQKDLANGRELHTKPASLDAVLAMVSAANEGTESVSIGQGAGRNISIINEALGHNTFQVARDGAWQTLASDWTIAANPVIDSSLSALGYLGYTGD